MNRYQNIIGKLNYGLFLTVVALLPFPQIFLRYAFVAWIIAWLLEGRWFSKPKSLKENTMAIPFILFGIWYVWQIVSWFWAPDHDAWAWQMERYLTFIGIVPIGLWGVNKYYNWRTIGKVLVISCVASIPVYLILLAGIRLHPEIVAHYHLQKFISIWHTSWWPYFADSVSFFKHRLFWCSVELFGIIVASQVYKEKKWLAATFITIMLSPILLTGSRQSVLTAAALMAVGLVGELPKRYRLRYGVGILLLGMVLGGGLLMLHPRMKGFNPQTVTEMRDISGDHDVRFNIWGAALQTPSDYLTYGIGAGQSTNYMVAKYHQFNMEYYWNEHYHPHNQYLEALMELGIGGLLLFLLAWLSIPLCAQKKGRLTAILFTVLFAMNMLTDCMFGKFDGIALWAVGLLLIFLQSNPKREE